VRYNIGKVLWIEEVVLQAQINNLFNELYAPFANEYGYFSAAERNFYLGIQLGL
jgi:outer membrane receptor protein involved in Fe transport